MRAALRALHRPIDELDAPFLAHHLECLDVVGVEDVVGVIPDIRRAVGRAAECLPVDHQGGAEVGKRKVLDAVEAIGQRELVQLGIELLRERELEMRARAPEEVDADLPRWVGDGVEVAGIDAQEVEQEARDVGRSAFADADDAQRRIADNLHAQLGKVALDGERGHQAGTAGTENYYATDHRRHLVRSNCVAIV